MLKFDALSWFDELHDAPTDMAVVANTVKSYYVYNKSQGAMKSVCNVMNLL